MGIVPLGYHGSTETIREVAKNNEESISEWLVQKTQGPQKIRNKEKRPKTRRTNSVPPRKKKEKSPTPKREEEEKQRNSKRKKGVKRKGKKKQHNSTPRKKKGMKKRKRIRRYLLTYVCHSLIYE